ncbi:GNAT family N-acetyltransferase [Halobaculum sp. CBA1158]|uniref:tRNA(Met) cytidine acetyltransferase TmcA n=1 Tax=Halobaculum sp. CBA1158 TaxID=2904243 RepID=UPI001F1DD40D|nr:tRNA(Met) cytidine acetyltransferase TmcA [Halobaculum sp. CBA1158]UIO98555.1 GNAT family N-acetyltransferase [Halobaculum sp. CBA1158]
MTRDAIATLSADLRAEARWTNQRRLLVLHGDRDACLDAAFTAVEAAGIDDDDAAILSTREGFRFDRHRPKHARRLLGTTREAVILDAFAEFSPNAIGQSVGAVDGGGLYVLLAPPLDKWPDRRDEFDESLAVPPFGLDDVSGRFRTRLVGTLRSHPGVAVVDVGGEGGPRADGDSDADETDGDGVDGGANGDSDGDGDATADATVERDGLTGTDSPPPTPEPTVPPDATFPAAAYESCLTRDQSRAVSSLERLREPGSAVVVEADRGRGKSSAAGLSAASLAAEGRDVLVTAPSVAGASALFERARALLSALDATLAVDEERRIELADGGGEGGVGSGRIRYLPPAEAAAAAGDADAVVADEAAALPVRLLADLLDAPAAAFVTTVHGYEGAGRGFSVRFRDRLDSSDRRVTDVRMDDPIRYARGDPVEGWSFRALALDARPAVDAAVADATTETVESRALDPDDLLADEHLLGEAFGLLVLAHYRTEPNDLARLLDAPNLSVRALTHDGHVVSVALLAREGGLDPATREAIYEGERVRGNMVPDVLTSQLRDPDGAAPTGRRVMRIATHPAVRRRGLGSRLLADVADDRPRDVDYLSTAFGATPGLLDFWAAAGYRTVHLATTRNDASGEHSAVMLRPTAEAGRALAERHARWFRERIVGVLPDSLRDLDPDVVRAALAACDADGAPAVDCSAYEWRVAVAAAHGPGLADTAPRPIRRLALAHLLDRVPDGADEVADAVDRAGDGSDLSPTEERLLVDRALQARPWDEVAEELDYVSPAECMRAFGRALRPLVERYGGDAAAAERERFE